MLLNKDRKIKETPQDSLIDSFSYSNYYCRLSISWFFEMETTTRNFIENYSKCQICEKTFATNQRKSQHMRKIHGKVKMFACNVCNKIFAKKCTLTSHLKNYHQEGQRHYKCDSCGKAFSEAGTLKNHINAIH